MFKGLRQIVASKKEAGLYQCGTCGLFQYHYKWNLTSNRVKSCRCKSINGLSEEGLFSTVFSNKCGHNDLLLKSELGPTGKMFFALPDHALYAQPSFKVNGKKHSFDYVFIPAPGGHLGLKREHFLANKNLKYVFVEVLDANHKLKHRYTKDINLSNHVLKEYPNSKIMFVSQAIYSKANIDEMLKFITSDKGPRIKMFCHGKHKYPNLEAYIKSLTIKAMKPVLIKKIKIMLDISVKFRFIK